MQRLRPLDVALLIGFVSLWVLCFALYASNIAHGRLARIPLLVTAPNTTMGYPRIRALLSGTKAELAVGDQLIRMGEADLRGVGPFGFTAHLYEQIEANLQVPVTILRDGVLATRVLTLQPHALPWRSFALAVGFAVTAVVVLYRRPGVRVARAFFLAGMTYSVHWLFFPGGPRWQTYAWILVLILSALVMLPLWLRFLLLLPEELAPPGSRLPRWPWLFAVFGPSLTSRVFGVPGSLAFGLRAEIVVTMAACVAMLTLLTHNFHRAGPLGRRQLKWVMYGLYIGLVPLLAADIIVGLYPTAWWLHESSTAFIALIPPCFFLAIMRSHLFDIDRLISSTAAYSIVLIGVGVGASIAVPTASASLSAFVGVDHAIGQTTLSFLLAAVVLPGQRYLRPQIERFFFAQRYTVEQGVRQLKRSLSVQSAIPAMLALIGEQLFTLLQAENCIIYGRMEARYEPLFARGAGEPFPFAAASPIAEVLQARATMRDVGRWRRMARTLLSQTERSVVDHLRVAAVLVIRRDETPLVLICLGAKRSGDVYTSTDTASLSELSQSLAQALACYTVHELTQQLVIMREGLFNR